MRISDLFVGEHADYYAKQAFGLSISSTLGLPSELLELLGNLHNRIENLEDHVEELELKVKELEKQLKRKR